LENQEGIVQLEPYRKWVSMVPMLVLLALSAQAASVPKEMMGANTLACMQGGALLDKNAPADKAKWPIYCQCVSEQYWRTIPQADYDGMMSEYQAGNFNGAHGKALNEHAEERLQAAGKKCNGA